MTGEREEIIHGPVDRMLMIILFDVGKLLSSTCFHFVLIPSAFFSIFIFDTLSFTTFGFPRFPRNFHITFVKIYLQGFIIRCIFHLYPSWQGIC